MANARLKGITIITITNTITMTFITISTTVEPVYNGHVLSGHPLLSGRGHPLEVPYLSFFVRFTCIKRPPLNGNLKPHIISRGILLGLTVFKKRSITTGMTKLMFIINRSLWF